MAQETTRTVAVSVYHDAGETFGVVEEHRSDLPKPMSDAVDEFAVEYYNDAGEGGERVAEMEYVPGGEIVEIRQTE